MLVWIDAAAPAARLQVFGLTVTERHLQALMRLDPKPTKVIIDVGSKDPADLRIPARVLKALPIVSSQSTAPFPERLREALRMAGDAPLLILDGTTLADQRLHGQLIRAEHNLAVFSPDAKESAAMLFLRMAGSVAAPDDATDVTSFARGLVTARIAEELTQDQFDGFIRKLRRTVPFYMFRILDQTKAAEIQRFLFWSNYKGSTDIFTRYVYPPLVWIMVRPLAKARIHPNLVTLVSIALTFGAVPFFADGNWLVGFLMAYGMSVLDSVDGKLARLTFTDSRLGNFLDHGLDMVHPPIWYVAWAYGLGLSAQGWNSRARLGDHRDHRVLCAGPADPQDLSAVFPARLPHPFQDGCHGAQLHRAPQHQHAGVPAGLHLRPGARGVLPDRVLAVRDRRLSRHPHLLDPRGAEGAPQPARQAGAHRGRSGLG